jgi:hypothetical protein
MTDTRKREILQGGGSVSGGGTGSGESIPPNSDRNSSSSNAKGGELPEAAIAATANKRTKKAWLNFTGKRHTRVGLDYQVAVLPSCHSADTNEETAPVVSGENSPVASS